ncbi:MAG TPA: CaiB/BaiF CoA-transferase family protein [Geminicoccaceae bacterium]|nr:CaiB/BaiF CoA-transferase family protein [Geminicoccaceae bacterium]
MKLEGIRVVDLSLFLPGPAMTQTMADHGAEVIKVEPLPAGEPCRAIGARRDGVTVWFANTHRGKKSLTLNLKTPEGVEALLRLAETADVFVEAFRPGVVDRLGVGYRAVAARNPRIVYVSISAYGQSGPYAQLPAHDLAVEAMSGVLSVNVGWDDRPWNPAIQAADMLASHIALSGVLMALLRRERTGKGDYLDIALLDALIAAMPNNYGPPMAEKRDPVPKDERSWGGNAMFRVYETKDGRFVALGGSEIKFATNLLTALGLPDLIELCKLPPGPGQQPVREFLEATFRTRTQAEWVAWMADKDVAFAPVKTLREGLDDPQVRHREMVVEDARGWEHIGLPIKFEGEPGRIDFALPELGEHSEEILRGLGYGDADLAAMKSNGVY